MFLSKAFVAAGLLTGQALTAPSLQPRDLTSSIAVERPIALQGILNNIGPDGSEAHGASAGVIIASPSTAGQRCSTVTLTC
jgi:glucoamylase